MSDHEDGYWEGHSAGTDAIETEVYKLSLLIETLVEALKPFAGIKADDGDDFSKWPDEVIIKCEASVREIKKARAAIAATQRSIRAA